MMLKLSESLSSTILLNLEEGRENSKSKNDLLIDFSTNVDYFMCIIFKKV
jgi:hypothetical protein